MAKICEIKGIHENISIYIEAKIRDTERNSKYALLFVLHTKYVHIVWLVSETKME